MRSRILLAAALAALSGCSSTQTARESESSTARTLVRVKTAYRTGQLKLWTSDDGKSWKLAADSSAFRKLEPDEKTHVPYIFALRRVPARLRVGVTGAFLGRVSVDSVEVFLGTEPRRLLGMESVGEVVDPENAQGVDGKCALIIHRGQDDVVDALELRLEPTSPPPPRRAARVRFGNYTGPGNAEDRRAAAIAEWDLTVFQEGEKLGDCVRKVKSQNPGQRVALRLIYPCQGFMLYAYDPDSRKAIRDFVLGQFSGFADLVDTVTLSEEEPGNVMRGLYGSPIPPESVWLWRHRFERETGKPFAWPSPDVDMWVGEKFHDMLNDLYDTIKARHPRIKVYQWVELRGYGNISGFPEYVRGEDLRMDGFVIEWADAVHDELIDTPLGKAVVRKSYFERYLDTLMARNRLQPKDILGQVWAHDPLTSPTIEQIEAERELGVEDIYFFWPAAAVPDVFDLYGGASDAPEWRYAREVWEKFKPMMTEERRRLREGR